MTVDDVRTPVEVPEHLQRAAAEENESLGIVWVHVDAIAVIVLGILDQIDRNISLDAPLKDGRFLHLFARALQWL